MFEVQKKCITKNSRVANTKREKPTIWSKSAMFDSKKSRKKEAGGLLNSLGIRAPLSHIPLGIRLLF